MELLRARKEAYEERMALKAKVEARKRAEEREREQILGAEEKNNA